KQNSTKINKSAKNIPANPVRNSGKGPSGPLIPPSQSSSSLKEHTCITEKSDLMQISLYKAKDKKGGSGSGPTGAKPPEHDQDSPEVFENAQVVSLHPLNVTQIFVDSVVPQTNLSKVHTDILDQNTLENVDLQMDDQIYSACDSDEERHPEMPQPRPRANVLQPEDETLRDTFSDRAGKTAIRAPSERRITTTARVIHHPSTTPPAFTPPPPTKSEKPLATHTGKRTPTRGGISTRTTATARILRGTATEHRQLQPTQYGDAPKEAANTCLRYGTITTPFYRQLTPFQQRSTGSSDTANRPNSNHHASNNSDGDSYGSQGHNVPESRATRYGDGEADEQRLHSCSQAPFRSIESEIKDQPSIDYCLHPITL
ncbi:hypothetical protein PFISCL1PPCAC_20323, partial [Pristionchus fissidentatus]